MHVSSRQNIPSFGMALKIDPCVEYIEGKALNSLVLTLPELNKMAQDVDIFIRRSTFGKKLKVIFTPLVEKEPETFWARLRQAYRSRRSSQTTTIPLNAHDLSAKTIVQKVRSAREKFFDTVATPENIAKFRTALKG